MRGMQTTAREPAWKGAALVTGGFVVLLWLLEIFDAATGNPLDAYGVQPRTEDGLVGVALAPTLHFGFDHLVSNTVPVLVLGFLTLATGLARGLAATAIIWVVGGLGVWLFAQPGSTHAGASVLIFGGSSTWSSAASSTVAPSRSSSGSRSSCSTAARCSVSCPASRASRGRATSSAPSAASLLHGC